MLQNNNKYKVLKVFSDSSTTEFGLREISRKIGLALPSVKNYFSELELIELSGINDEGIFLRNIERDFLDSCNYGCGLFWFTKK